MQTLKQLALEIHNDNKAKGFWDKPRELSTICLLINTEISEAVEAQRKGKFAKGANLDKILNSTDEYFVQLFLDNVKDTFEDEIADALIRILDLVGSQKTLDEINFEIALNSISGCFINDYEERDNRGDCSISRQLLFVQDCVSSLVFRPRKNIDTDLLVMLVAICSLSFNMGFDLEKHISLKLRYNRTRPYKHGKQF